MRFGPFYPVVLATCTFACTSFKGEEPADASADANGDAEPVEDLQPTPTNPGAKINCGTIVCGGTESCCLVSGGLGCSSKCDAKINCDSDDDCGAGSVCCATFLNSGALVNTSCAQAIRCKTSVRYRHICNGDGDCGGGTCEVLPKASPLKGCK